MTPVIVVALALMWVFLVAFAFGQFRKAGRAGTLHPQLSNKRVPTDRGWLYWLHPNANRGEYWPLWYWLLMLVVFVAIAMVAVLLDAPIYAVGLAVGSLMVLWAIYRRLRFGFQGPSRTAAPPTGITPPS